MPRFSIFVGTVLVICGSSSEALCWHKVGHMMTALIAYDQLDSEKQQELVDILNEHPRIASDFEMPHGMDQHEQDAWLVCLAAVWPDAVRVRGHDGNIPANPEVRTSYHREKWHFINEPLVLLPSTSSDAARQDLENKAKQLLNISHDAPATESLDMNAVQALAFNSRIVKESHDPKARAVAICWILHIVGDLHQPLHSTALFTKRMFAPDAHHRTGDRGGNLITIGESASQNLHSLWDDGPGPNRLAMPQAVSDLVDMLLDDSDLKQLGTQAAQQTDPTTWVDESFALAKKEAYDPIHFQILAAERRGDDPINDAPLVMINSGYKANAHKVSDQRVVQGGYRLGAVLKQLMQ